ncbi:hypothetical protein [Streptomyces sp. RKAG337]|uniref:hypothetical protein n=1 Tax=Streptomyces sp. RKAG337 TaxID=2893404 RepID=UPI002033834F|nr:hypothetical protein [Streptomyces sp. RKAG337]MCM2427353.1 hypothetical protein [Streptomyces sp. RKAG337]
MNAPDLATVRAAAGEWLRGMTGDARPAWRVVSIDGADPATGIGPACLDEDHEATDSSPYECCPEPLIETESAPLAEYLVALLNADAGKATRTPGAKVTLPPAPARLAGYAAALRAVDTYAQLDDPRDRERFAIAAINHADTELDPVYKSGYDTGRMHGGARPTIAAERGDA